MAKTGLTAGIVGGSVSGCAAATALIRAGWDVEVFERSSRGLQDRGSGILIPSPLRSELIAKGYLPDDYPYSPLRERWWQFADGTRLGRRLWTQPMPAIANVNNWGNLWAALRKLVPEGHYHDGKSLCAVESDEESVVARFADGTERSFDLLVGADGYHSVVRKHLFPHVEPEFANYILWRGNYPEEELDDRRFIEALDRQEAWLTVPFHGGHVILYMIPGFDGDNTPGKRRVNWGVYAACPPQLALNGVESEPPGSVTPDLYANLTSLLAAHIPPAIAALIAHSRREDVSIQPIYDSVVESYVGDRVLLIGDAGTITRPHTGSGATKALEDALALESVAREAPDVPTLLSRYDRERCNEAKMIGELGRRLGQAQVVETPDYARMTPADFETWSKGFLAGAGLYLYGENA